MAAQQAANAAQASTIEAANAAQVNCGNFDIIAWTISHAFSSATVRLYHPDKRRVACSSSCSCLSDADWCLQHVHDMV